MQTKMKIWEKKIEIEFEEMKDSANQVRPIQQE